MGVPILFMVRHLDVGFSYPPVAGDRKGAAVLRIKRNMSWVQYGASQYGPYVLWSVSPDRLPLYERTRQWKPMMAPRSVKFLTVTF